MHGSKSALLFSLLFLLAALFLCPLTQALFGVDSPNATQAVQVYYWAGACLFVFLALFEFPVVDTRIKQVSKYAILLILVFACTEVVSSFTYYLLSDTWAHRTEKNQNQYLFEEHPLLVGSLIKNATHTQGKLTYAHNSHGYRSDEFTIKKPAGMTRIVAIGGSTTYGVGVNNNETWPHHLAKELGHGYEVINMGVPGYSSAENLIQTQQQVGTLNPDWAVYLIGLNDLRSMNIENLKPDYSDFHQPSLYGAFGLCANENLPPLAILKLIVLLGQQLGLIATCPNQSIDITTKKHQGVDQQALAIYTRNLQRIVESCHSKGINVLFVPQILLEEVLTTGDYSWWIPFIPTEEIDDMMTAYNEALKTTAQKNNVIFAADVLKHNWNRNDFVDLSHFTNEANAALAKIIAQHIAGQAQSDTVTLPVNP